MKSSSSATPFTPRIQFANVPISIAIGFGMWLCWVASSGEAMPLSFVTEPLKALGLFFFRAEWMLRVVFWLGVVAHVLEALFALRFAAKVSGGDIPFCAFWTIQTAAVGFPSLKLIKEQRRRQIKSLKAAAGTSGAAKSQ